MAAHRPSGSEQRRPLYPVEPWRIRELGFDPATAARNETVFSLANGHLGLRGNLEEDEWNIAHGTYVNGFHEEVPITYGESAFGLARNHQVMLNVADGKRIVVEVDGIAVDLGSGLVEGHERVLDLRTGVLSRSFRWRGPGGQVVEIRSRRLVSLSRPSLAVIEFGVTMVEGGGSIRLRSLLDARVRNREVSDDPRVGSHLPAGSLQLVETRSTGHGGVVVQRTRGTRLALAAAAEHRLEASSRARPATSCFASDGGITFEVLVRLLPGEGLTVTKHLAYCTSLDEPEERIADRASDLLVGIPDAGFAVLAAEQQASLDAFWAASDVQIEGDGALQQGVRFNLFSIFQSAGRDGRTSLAAKGLTGEGYEGHYFWDTEIFALPFFIYTQPHIARALLSFRVATLPHARERAAEMHEAGALYPWRTINGTEASAYFPAGTAQYHINADIAYAIARYVAATGDRSLLLEGGAEVLFETARLWMSLGAFVARRGGEFCINGVTGPDEYTVMGDNNVYTNLMARAHLRYAARVADELAVATPDAFHEVALRIGLAADEVAGWRAAAERMRIPLDPALGIHAQDDSFLDHEPWDFEATPEDHRPLLLHYHPLVIYRHQVLKQPDVVLAQVLLGSEFSAAQKRRNYDYYDPLTTRDSSLSPCTQSVAAAELGYTDAAYRYFLETARMDLDDVNGNVAHGVHVAAMAGSWVSLVYGFAGLRDDDGRLAFAPRLPPEWSRLAFHLQTGASRLHVEVHGDRVRYTLEPGSGTGTGTGRGRRPGPGIEVFHFDRPLRLEPGVPVELDLQPRLAAVIFDLDGVLTDTAEHHFQAWRRVADEESLPFDRDLNERLKGVSRLESLQIILDNAGEELGLRDKVRLADRKNAYFRELIASITPADVLPGMRELLVDLRARGAGIGIASMSHNVFDVVRRLGIEDLVDVIVDPGALVKGKPDPEIFLTAAERLRVRFEDCVGIEDARAGIDAIRAAGMVPVGIGTDLPGAAWTVTDTRDVTADALAELVERGRASVRTTGG